MDTDVLVFVLAVLVSFSFGALYGARSALERVQRKHVIVDIERWRAASEALAVQQVSQSLLFSKPKRGPSQ